MISAELLFKALADPTRQRLLAVLSNHELSVSELVEVLAQPQSTISRHLKVLRECGLLIDHRAGTTVRYAALPAQPVVDAAPAMANSAPGIVPELARPDSPAQLPEVSDAGVALEDGEAAGSGGTNGNGGSRSGGLGSRTAVLRNRLLEWVAQESLDENVNDRLGQVIRRRQTANTEFFDEVGARWDQLRIDAFGESFHLEALATLLPREWVVTDVGTGTGYLLPTLVRQFARVIAVDPAESMLSLARSRSDLLGPGNHGLGNHDSGHHDDSGDHGPGRRGSGIVEFRQGSASQLPIADMEVDLLVASLVLHHVNNPQTALAEFQRCLKPTGRVLLIEQDHHHDAEFHERMGDEWWGFSPATLAEWLNEQRFTNIQWHPLRSARASWGRGGESPPIYVMTAEAMVPAAKDGRTGN